MLLGYRTKLLIFIKDLIKDKKDLINKQTNLKKLNFGNSRENNYKKLIKVINEN